MESVYRPFDGSTYGFSGRGNGLRKVREKVVGKREMRGVFTAWGLSYGILVSQLHFSQNPMPWHDKANVPFGGVPATSRPPGELIQSCFCRNL